MMESSAAATTVVDIYNSSNQVLFEPGILDTVGNALLNIMPNLSAAPFLTNSVENSNYFFNEASSVHSSGTNNESLVENVNILRHEPAIIGIICLFYGFVFIFGIVGNLLTIMVVVRLPRMRNVTNYFIVSLAVADLLVLALCLPGTLMSNIFIPWVLGRIMCKIVPYFQGVAINASVYSLIAVSQDRFLAICFPLKFQITTRRARKIIFVIWLYSLIVPIPWLIFFDLHKVIAGDDTTFCLEEWPFGGNGSLYFIFFNVILGYLLPLLVISVCYVHIYVKVWKRDIPTDSKNAQMERMQQNSKIKVIKMLLLVVILFVVSWAPLYVIFARIKLGDELSELEAKWLPYVAPAAQFLGISNSSINPVLYAFFNNKFRRAFNAVLSARPLCSTVKYYDTVHVANSSTTSLRKSSSFATRAKNSLNRQSSNDRQLACISEGPIGV